jgi:hypothetical protein
MSNQSILLTTGLACLIAAIVGGGVSFDKITIPKILSPVRQVWLGLLGVALSTFALVGANVGVIILSVWFVALMLALIQTGQKEAKYKKQFAEHFDQSQKLIDDAKQAFFEDDYKWTIKFISQAGEAARDDSWQSGYAFLLGAQLALRRNDAVRTKIDIMDCIAKAAENRTGYFSSTDALHELRVNLGAVRSAIAGDDKAGTVSSPIRTEIDSIVKAL